MSRIAAVQPAAGVAAVQYNRMPSEIPLEGRRAPLRGRARAYISVIINNAARTIQNSEERKIVRCVCDVLGGYSTAVSSLSRACRSESFVCVCVCEGLG